jgi:peptidoglycan hydrolase-like protein with peptidoglycan-binding domain
MANRGWAITVDDQYGPASARVAYDFQQEKQLSDIDGLVGPETWNAAFTLTVT